MSSVLYVEVTSKQLDRLTCLLLAIQQLEGYQFVESPTLALQIIWESWVDMKRGVLKDRSGQGHGLYCPFNREEAIARATASPIGFFMPEEFDDSFIEANAERFIRAVKIVEERYCGRELYHVFGPRPECLFQFQVADAHWLDHLEPGVCWDTTAFPYEWKSSYRS